MDVFDILFRTSLMAACLYVYAYIYLSRGRRFQDYVFSVICKFKDLFDENSN